MYGIRKGQRTKRSQVKLVIRSLHQKIDNEDGRGDYFSKRYCDRFDIQNFYKEVRRVLKPHGTLAAWCYMVPQVKDSAAASAAVNRFFFQTLKPYIEEPHKRFLEQYRTIEPQDTDFCEVKRDTLDFEQRSSIRLLVRQHHF